MITWQERTYRDRGLLAARDLLNCVSKGVPQAITSGDQKFEIVTKQLSSPTS